MFAKEIEAIFTQKVSEFIQNGYTLNLSTMGGSQGEIGKVDMRKGNEIIRIMLHSDSTYCKRGNCKYFCEFVALTVGRNTDEQRSSRPFDGFSNTIWNKNLEIIEQRKFFKVDGDADYFTEDENEYEAMKVKQMQRYRNRKSSEVVSELPKEKAAAVVLGWIRKQPRCKSVKLGEIEKVVRKVSYSMFNDSYKVHFIVTARGTQHTIK